jgi:hypothetical protein
VDRNTNRILFRQSRRQRCWCTNNIKMRLGEIGQKEIAGFNCLMTATNGETGLWTLGFHKASSLLYDGKNQLLSQRMGHVNRTIAVSLIKLLSVERQSMSALSTAVHLSFLILASSQVNNLACVIIIRCTHKYWYTFLTFRSPVVRQKFQNRSCI